MRFEKVLHLLVRLCRGIFRALQGIHHVSRLYPTPMWQVLFGHGCLVSARHLALRDSAAYPPCPATMSTNRSPRGNLSGMKAQNVLTEEKARMIVSEASSKIDPQRNLISEVAGSITVNGSKARKTWHREYGIVALLF